LRGFFRCLLTIVILSPLLSTAYAGTFKNPPLIPTITDPLGVASADLNHDGNLDLVYADGAGAHVLIGNGDGTFSHGQDISLPPGICGSRSCVVNIVDVNRDGIPDLIFTGFLFVDGGEETTAEVAAFLGNGDGSFQPPIVSSFPPAGYIIYLLGQQVAFGDINEDGAVDILAPLAGGLTVLLGDNSGKFSLGTSMFTYTSGANYLADLNGDGHLDIVTTDNLGAEFLVFFGNGDGTFRQPFARYQTGAPTGGMLLTDLDGDGHPDVVAEIYPGEIVILKGNPDGTFAAPSPIASIPTTVSVTASGDFNGDGLKDLFFLTPTGVGTALGQGNLAYGHITSSVSGSVPFESQVSTVAQGDFNSDGHLDIAMGVEGGIVILEGNGDGTFKSADFYDMGQTVGATAVADFNGDGIPDIAVTLPATFPRLLIGTGQGTFNLGPDPNPSYGSQSPFSNLEVGDFNGDGKKDLTMGNQVPNGASSGQQYAEFGNGNGSFGSQVPIPNGGPVVGDFNNDGRSDTISDGVSAINVSLGQADGSFLTVSTTLRTPSTQGLVGVGDVNHDGKLDVVIGYAGYMEVWLGNGDGTFSYARSIGNINGLESYVSTIADIDHDGNADIIVAGSSLVAIAYGNGDGTFQPPVFRPVSHSYSQIVVADVNMDNMPDLVLSDGISVAVLLNKGQRQFGQEIDYVAGSSISYLNVVDVNGDGFPDIVAANPAGTTVVVLLNEPNGTSPEGMAVSGNFTISPEPSNSGEPIVLTLTVSAAGAGAPVPTGSVTYTVDGSFIATVSLVNGTAGYTLATTLSPTQHTITATYDGDKVYAPASFAALDTILPPVYPTNTALVASSSSVLTSQTVRLTATVSGSPQPPSGVITFQDGNTTLGSMAINSNGIAYFDTAILSAGVHNLTATYQGDSQETYTGTGTYVSAIYSVSTSPILVLTVNDITTTTVLTASGLTPTAGTVVSFTANVHSSMGTPFGGVTFYDGAVNLGTSSLQSDGSASFSTASLGVGPHNVSAAFNPNASFGGSPSSALSVTVVAASAGTAATVISLSAENNSATGDSTLSAKVEAVSGSPSGFVIFLDSGQILASVATDGSGTATLPVTALSSGVHALSASFVGTAEFAPSVSPELMEQWPATGPGFSLGIAENFVPVVGASSENVQLTITPAAGFGQQVQLSCSAGLPSGYSCIFSPASLDAGGTSYLQIHRSLGLTESHTETRPWFVAVPGIFVFLLCLSPIRRTANRRPICFLMLVLSCLSFSILSGCESVSSIDRSQMFVASIQASAGTGTGMIVHTAQITVNISDLK
jgi:hypothetical protein